MSQHTAQVLAGVHVSLLFVDLVDPAGAGDHVVEVAPAVAVHLRQVRDVAKSFDSSAPIRVT